MRRIVWLVPVLLAVGDARAAVHAIEVTQRSPILNGQSMGAAGPYERIAGKVTFTLDPKLAANRIVHDLAFAAVNADGQVECVADFSMIKPVDVSKGNGTILFEVSNR